MGSPVAVTPARMDGLRARKPEASPRRPPCGQAPMAGGGPGWARAGCCLPPLPAAAGCGCRIISPSNSSGRVSLANWQSFGPRYAAFTVAFALGLAWVVTLQVHAMRRIARNTRAGRQRRGGPAGAVAAVVSLLPSLLCCSPAVPTLVGLVGLPAAAPLQTPGTITYFFATKQDRLRALAPRRL